MRNFKFLLTAAGIVLFFVAISAAMFWGAATCGEAMRREAEATPIATPVPGPEVADDGSGRLVQVIGLILLGGGLYYFWRRQRSLYESIKAREGPTLNTRVRSSIAQLNVSHEGEPVIEERIRGIEELGKIVQESPQDYWPVMDVLSRYVRQNAPLDADRADYPDVVRPDVQMAMTTIGARRHTRRGSDRLNISETDLRGVNLPGAHLERVDLSGTRLDGAVLINAHLEQADLTGADLRKADLRGAQGLTHAQLDAAITTSSTQLPEDVAP
ncbi:MAG: pentapeptide repeat-containing protein [Chloroflexota bacterium]|nr:pentapeptide repeat-containing protein [Chloroflexota bacterium]